MDATAKIENHDVADDTTSFDIQVCSDDGRVLNTFRLTRPGDNVATLDAAEEFVRSGFSDYKGEPLVVYVSQETLTKFRQLQIKVSASIPDAA